MKTWITEHKDEVWKWIEECYYENNSEEYDCSGCLYKPACDALWDIIKYKLRD